MNQPADLVVANAAVYTCDPQNTWAESFAVAQGRIVAVGTAQEIRELAGPGAEVIDLGGRMVMPGLCDVHIHLGYGGNQVAWELTVWPTDTLDQILDKVAAHAGALGPDEWIVGGIVGSTVFDKVSEGGCQDLLDAAAGGRPVLLRDESMHNRWLNSRALEIIGVGNDTPDPDGGAYVRDATGKLTGVLLEMASKVAEDAVHAAIANPEERLRVSYRTALDVINSFGVTAVQDAATLEHGLKTLASLDDDGELSAWVVASLPARPFFEDGAVGEDLFAVAGTHRRTHVRPDFVKLFLDGVPMTRTSAMLAPYICHGSHEDPGHTGEPYWSLDDLVAVLERNHELGLSTKMHCSGDGAVRRALDGIEVIRKAHGDTTIFQIAHAGLIDPADLSRFAKLGVAVDASPYMWYPGPILESSANQIPSETLARSFPFNDLVSDGTLVAAGSDWPVVPLPNPWVGLETLVTRANPDPAVPGTLNPAQSLSLPAAIAAFTSDSATAVGLGDTIGRIRPGYSADFIVLNHNLFDIRSEQIHQTQVELTYFQGRQVYDRAAAASDR